MLARPARVCRRSWAAGAWLIDYGVAVALDARDWLRPSRASLSRAEPWMNESDDPARLSRPVRVAASMGLIGVLSVSVAGALWREAAPAETPIAVLEQYAPTLAQPPQAVLAWAPLVPGDRLLRQATGATAPLAATVSQAAEVESAPVAAAAAQESFAPEPTPDPTPRVAAPPPALVATPAPTQAPTPATAPAPAPGTQLTRAQVRSAALSAGWPESELDELLSVAWCESRFRIDADGWGALGLMQIMPAWFESLGLDLSWAFDPVTNFRVAYHIHQNDLRNGYGEWSSWTCKPGGVPYTTS